MHFLFAMFQGGGNIPLIMPIVGRLVARGHTVQVLAGPGIRPSRLPVDPRFLERIGAAGAVRVSFAEPSTHPFDDLHPVRGVVQGWVPQRLRRIARTEARTALWSPAWATNVARQVQDAPPDVLVADFCLLGALAAAEAARIPSAALVHHAFPPYTSDQPPLGFGFQPARNPLQFVHHLFWHWARDRVWTREALEPHNMARAALGLQALRSPFQQYDLANRVLVLGSQVFDFPSSLLPTNVRYVGTPIDDVGVPADRWSASWPASDGMPLILVSLSTLNQGQAGVMQRILDALDGMPVRALVTIGPSLDAAAFRAPPNAVVETFVPHSAVLPDVAAMVTQCGLGSLTKALIHGVPLVCLPLVGDQPDNAARIVAHGAGLRLPSEASPDRIRTALHRVLDEPGFRHAASRLSVVLAAETPEDTAADELEALAKLASARTTLNA